MYCVNLMYSPFKPYLYFFDLQRKSVYVVNNKKLERVVFLKYTFKLYGKKARV